MKSLKINDQLIAEITEPVVVQPALADILVECRATNGMLCLSFATVIIDESRELQPEARVTARLRIPLPAVAFLQQNIGRALNPPKPMADPGKETAN